MMDNESDFDDTDAQLARRSTWTADVSNLQFAFAACIRASVLVSTGVTQEDARLKRLVQAYGAANWSVIAQVR